MRDNPPFSYCPSTASCGLWLASCGLRLALRAPWPFATAVLGFVFAWLVFRQWLERRKPHQLAWTVGLVFYALAALMESWSEYTGSWNTAIYRVYIVLAAALVGFLGLGTLYLIARRRLWGHLYLTFNVVCMAIFLYGTFTSPIRGRLAAGITVGGSALGPPSSFPRIMSLPFNVPGSVLLLGGALLSVWRFARKREYRYRMWANVLIALGTIVIAAVGAKARAGSSIGLYPAEMVASALLLWGFLLAGTLEKGARAAAGGKAADDLDEGRRTAETASSSSAQVR